MVAWAAWIQVAMIGAAEMIEISSYLRDADGQFARIGDADFPPPDSRHIEGAIELSVCGVLILDKGMWDYVDQLWAYIVEMISTLEHRDDVSTYFPDQPIMLSFANQKGGRVLVASRVGERVREASVSKRDLVAAIRVHGSEFFQKMARLVPENRSSYTELQSRLNLV